MHQFHKHPGAVISAGNFACLTAARNLASHGIPVYVLGSTTSLARFSNSVSHFVCRPKEIKDDDLPHFLVDLAEKCFLRRWVLFPGSDEHLKIMAKNYPLLMKHYILTAPHWEVTKFLYDKRLTYKLAKEAGVATPRSWVPEGLEHLGNLPLEFPVVLKPAISSTFLRATNRKALLAHNWNQLLSFYMSMAQLIGPSEVIVQDYLPEPSKNLFSYGGFFRKGKPVSGLSVKRTRQFPNDFGRNSSYVEMIDLPELEELSSQLLSAISYTGLAEVEFMWNAHHSRFELLEVNARLWAWHSLAIVSGIELPYYAFADAMGHDDLPRVKIRQGIKWIRFLSDVRAAKQEILSGSLSFREYLRSFRGPKTFSVFSLSDPVPSFIEPMLLLLDRLKNRKSASV